MEIFRQATKEDINQIIELKRMKKIPFRRYVEVRKLDTNRPVKTFVLEKDGEIIAVTNPRIEGGVLYPARAIVKNENNYGKIFKRIIKYYFDMFLRGDFEIEEIYVGCESGEHDGIDTKKLFDIIDSTVRTYISTRSEADKIDIKRIIDEDGNYWNVKWKKF